MSHRLLSLMAPLLAAGCAASQPAPTAPCPEAPPPVLQAEREPLEVLLSAYFEAVELLISTPSATARDRLEAQDRAAQLALRGYPAALALGVDDPEALTDAALESWRSLGRTQAALDLRLDEHLDQGEGDGMPDEAVASIQRALSGAIQDHLEARGASDPPAQCLLARLELHSAWLEALMEAAAELSVIDSDIVNEQVERDHEQDPEVRAEIEESLAELARDREPYARLDALARQGLAVTSALDAPLTALDDAARGAGDLPEEVREMASQVTAAGTLLLASCDQTP